MDNQQIKEGVVTKIEGANLVKARISNSIVGVWTKGDALKKGDKINVIKVGGRYDFNSKISDATISLMVRV